MREDRLEKIASFVNQRGEVSVSELSQLINVPQATVRRDLKVLHEQHRIRRSYGLAQALPATAISRRIPDDTPPPSETAAAALGMITPGNVVILPRGHVNIEIAHQLSHTSNVTIITNSCAVFDTIKQSPGTHVIALGGIYSRIGDCTYGPVAENSLFEIRADILMLEPSGIDLAEGVTHDNMIEVSLLKQMIRAARRVVLIAREDAFDRLSGAVIGKLDSFSAVIAAAKLPDEYRDFFRAHHIEVTTAGDR